MKLYKHGQIKSGSSQVTRPTSAKVRQALFNIWQGEIIGTSWLDLCAGTGAVGAMALVQGARKVTGIEINRPACQIIQENWQKFSQEGQVFQVLSGDILTQLKRLPVEEEFDFIYFDPPYQSNLYDRVLKIIVSEKLLTIEGELAVEHNPKFWQPEQIIGLEMSRQKHYGDTFLSFFRVSQTQV